MSELGFEHMSFGLLPAPAGGSGEAGRKPEGAWTFHGEGSRGVEFGRAIQSFTCEQQGRRGPARQGVAGAPAWQVSVQGMPMD